MLGRSKLVVKTARVVEREARDEVVARLRVGRGRQRHARHAGEARRAARASCRYSGRKSWPHWLTQCASSMAKSAMRQRVQQVEEAVRDQPLRRDVEQFEPALDAGRGGSRPASSAVSAELSAAAAHAGLPQRLHLVAHQRDQRRDDDGRALAGTAPAPGSRSTCRRRSGTAPPRRRPPTTWRTTSSCRPRKAACPNHFRSASTGSCANACLHRRQDFEPAGRRCTAKGTGTRRRWCACGRGPEFGRPGDCVRRGAAAQPFTAAATAGTARRLSAAMVSVGLAVAEVGKTVEPRMKRLRCSWLRRSRSTTDVFGSSPMRAVPMMWPAPWASPLCWICVAPSLKRWEGEAPSFEKISVWAATEAAKPAFVYSSMR